MVLLRGRRSSAEQRICQAWARHPDERAVSVAAVFVAKSELDVYTRKRVMIITRPGNRKLLFGKQKFLLVPHKEGRQEFAGHKC